MFGIRMRYAVAALALIGAMGTATPARAQRPDPPSLPTVKAAIQRLLAKPATAPDSKDWGIVFVHILSDTDIAIEAPETLVVPPNGSEDRLLQQYFVLGAAAYDLAHPEKAKDLLADKIAAVRAELTMYRALRARNNAFRRPLLDKLAELDRKNALAAHIRTAMRGVASGAREPLQPTEVFKSVFDVAIPSGVRVVHFCGDAIPMDPSFAWELAPIDENLLRAVIAKMGMKRATATERPPQTTYEWPSWWKKSSIEAIPEAYFNATGKLYTVWVDRAANRMYVEFINN